jgi:hypothetical protein
MCFGNGDRTMAFLGNFAVNSLFALGACAPCDIRMYGRLYHVKRKTVVVVVLLIALVFTAVHPWPFT